MRLPNKPRRPSKPAAWRRSASTGNLVTLVAVALVQANTLLPAMLTMMLYQMMQSQPPQETEPFWLLNDPANDDPAFPDNLWEP